MDGNKVVSSETIKICRENVKTPAKTRRIGSKDFLRSKCNRTPVSYLFFSSSTSFRLSFFYSCIDIHIYTYIFKYIQMYVIKKKE